MPGVAARLISMAGTATAGRLINLITSIQSSIIDSRTT